MPSMPRPSTPHGATPPPNCPICREPATRWGHNQRNGVTEANYLCANEHAWLTKWVAA